MMKSKINELVVYTDGASRGNPGSAGIGIVICDKNGNTIESYYKYIGITTNNVAEYEALVAATELVKKYDYVTAQYYLDSELVVKQMNGDYKVKNEKLKPLYKKVMDNISNSDCMFSHIRRELNKEADALAKKASFMVSGS